MNMGDGNGRTGVLPERLEKVRTRFEVFRKGRKPGSRIPDALWSAAVKVAGHYGINRTAKALGLDYYSLKKRVEAESAAPCVQPVPSTATFLELAPLAQSGPGECTVELEDSHGTKLRIHMKGFAAPDLAALSRSFRNPTP